MPGRAPRARFACAARRLRQPAPFAAAAAAAARTSRRRCPRPAGPTAAVAGRPNARAAGVTRRAPQVLDADEAARALRRLPHQLPGAHAPDTISRA